MLWNDRLRAVIAGDTLNLGSGLEIPASWLPEGVTVGRFVLPTHGEPTDRAALERALP